MCPASRRTHEITAKTRVANRTQDDFHPKFRLFPHRTFTCFNSALLLTLGNLTSTSGPHQTFSGRSVRARIRVSRTKVSQRRKQRQPFAMGSTISWLETKPTKHVGCVHPACAHPGSDPRCDTTRSDCFARHYSFLMSVVR